MERVDVIVIGAGVVGLAVGRALAEAGREVIILEKHDAFGTETSARNSEVIHAGIYYRPDGMRAKLCHHGKELLYTYCADHFVAHEQCGKLVVAHGDDEITRLDALIKNAEASGVYDLQKVSKTEANALEPNLQCDAALISPSSGIIDSHSLMLAFLGDLEHAGGALVLSSPVISGNVLDDGIAINVGGEEPISLVANLVINCAGLYADQTAQSIAGLDPKFIPAIRPAKGQYFTYSGRAPFDRLIYPLHMPDSQGVHYTRDLGGQARLGPDIRWDAALGDYNVDVTRKQSFVESVSRFWPDLDPDKLQPGYAGQRPKVVGPGEEGDFQFLGPADHGTLGYIGLYGIESPGLTSCLAIGGLISEMAGHR